MAARSAFAVLAALWLAGCGQDNRYVAPPPPTVTVAPPVQRQVTRYFETTGSTAAVNSANLVARVQGFVQEISYQDGSFVAKGTPLFTIEPEPYRLKQQQAEAAEAAAQATLKQAEAEFERQTELAGRQVTSKVALDNATANRDSALARLQQAEADTRQAALNLGYTKVTAPFDGVVTARQVSVGELVGGGGATVLATIVQLEPIHVAFNVSERDVLRVRAEMAKRGMKGVDLKGAPIEIGLANDTGYPHRGALDYVAPALNSSTGTLAARAVFVNEGRVLLPGYFVRVRIPLDPRPSLLVPDAAVGTDLGGRYVLVVNRDDVVEQRKVEIGPVVGELRVIESGIAAEDRVVVAGLLRAVPGQKVAPQAQPAATARAD
ncbi:MAG: efflux RND transporter periplasmic adaptor subunit [Xanthobacteraceae bacterium]|nr:efflux RND transporter periplasmic adaptor subunit [Xanthobacteraceae bacterium]